MFTFRIKYYHCEDGEYTNPLPCTKEDIYSLLSLYWSGENLPNGVEIISVEDSGGRVILLEHSGKEVFEAYYLPLQNKFHFHKKSRIDLIYFVVDNFFDQDLEKLEVTLNKTKKENTYIRGDFYYKDFVYRVSKKRITASLLESLVFGLPISLVFFIMSIRGLIQGDPLVLFPAIFLVGSIWFWLPGLLLHYQYKKDGKDLAIFLTRGKDEIEITIGTRKFTHHKTDIKTIKRYENSYQRMSWSLYNYVEIEFKNGDIINLTNLMIDSWEVLQKFQNHGIEKWNEKTLLPFIQKRTRLNDSGKHI
jgi:hypothetical protein